VLVLQSGWKKHDIPNNEKGFQVPYLNSRYFLPFIWAGVLVLLFWWNRTEVNSFFSGSYGTVFSLSPGSWTRNLLLVQFPMLIFILSAIVLTWYG